MGSEAEVGARAEAGLRAGISLMLAMRAGVWYD